MLVGLLAASLAVAAPMATDGTRGTRIHEESLQPAAADAAAPHLSSSTGDGCSLCTPNGDCAAACNALPHYRFGICSWPGSSDSSKCCECHEYECVRTEPPNLQWSDAFSRIFDDAWTGEKCAASATTSEGGHTRARFVRLGYGGLRLGLNNQMLLLAGALAEACLDKSSLVIDVAPRGRVWYEMTASFRSNLSPDVAGRWSMVLDIGRLQTVLDSDERCADTRIVSPACIAGGGESFTLCHGVDGARPDSFFPSVQNGQSQARVELHYKFWGKMPLRDDLPWVPYRSTVSDTSPDLLRAKYHAVHLNLDVDWMIWSTDQKLYWKYKASQDASETEAIAQACCSDRGTPAGQWALGKLSQYVGAIRQIMSVSEAPIVVITAIGKPGTPWRSGCSTSCAARCRMRTS